MKRVLTTLACMLGMASAAPAEPQTPEAAFWAWFVENEDRLFHMKADATDAEMLHIFDELGPRLRQAHPDLTFEFSGVRDDGRREFIISADGVTEAIPGVLRVHRAASDLQRWDIIAFRQRGKAGDIGWKGETVSHESVSVALTPSEKPGRIDAVMFLPGVGDREKNDSVAIMFLLLDNALGEFDVMTKVGYVDLAAPGDEGSDDAISLAELPKIFDALHAELSRENAAEDDPVPDDH